MTPIQTPGAAPAAKPAPQGAPRPAPASKPTPAPAPAAPAPKPAPAPAPQGGPAAQPAPPPPEPVDTVLAPSLLAGLRAAYDGARSAHREAIADVEDARREIERCQRCVDEARSALGASLTERERARVAEVAAIDALIAELKRRSAEISGAGNGGGG